MKRLLLAAILAMPLLAMAQNDAPSYYAQTIVVPIVAEGGVSNGLAQVIDVRKQQNVALELTVSPTTITNQIYRFSGSVSGQSWVTNRFVIGQAGGTIVTNLAVGPIGYLRLDSVTNPGPGSSTNTAYYSIKISSP